MENEENRPEARGVEEDSGEQDCRVGAMVAGTTNLLSVGEGLHKDSPTRIHPGHSAAMNRSEAASLPGAAANRHARGTLRSSNNKQQKKSGVE